MTNSPMNSQNLLLQSGRWKLWEYPLWLLALASPFVLSSHALIINEIAIVALFALSLDLILGYTGIVSLGHAAFFGMGAYSAALFAKLVMPDPILGLAVGGTSSITGPLLAALLLGIADVAGKYYIPKLGGFIVYSLMIMILIWRPQGLFVRKGGK